MKHFGLLKTSTLTTVALTLTGCLQTQIMGPSTSTTPSARTQLSSPATASDILAGLQAYTYDGSVITGTLSCGGGGSSTFPESTASSAYRIDASTILLATLNPAGVGSRVQPLLSDEIAGNTTFTSNSRLVPDPAFDGDGRYTNGGGNLNYGYLATVKGRPTTACGLSGTTAERVADCASQNGTTAIWEAAKYGQSGEADWKLVTLYSAGTCSDGNSLSEATCGSCDNPLSLSSNTCGTCTSGTSPMTAATCTGPLGGTWTPGTWTPNVWTAGAGEGSTCSGGANSGCFEVWQDQRTQQVWSDAMTGGHGYGECSAGNQYLTPASCAANAGTWSVGWTNIGYNWFQASGYSSNADTTAITGYQGEAGTGTDCQDAGGNSIPCQPSTPISVCADAGAIAGLNGISTYQNMDGTNGTFDEGPSKGEMTGPTHQWRIPTIEDFEQANVDGVRKVLPNMDQVFWSASSYSDNVNVAWFFEGDVGYVGNDYRNYADNVVRCVGR